MARGKRRHGPVTDGGGAGRCPGLSVEEKRLVELHARRLVGERRISGLNVARDCYAEILRLHARRPGHRPSPLTFSSVYTYIKRTATRLGSAPVGMDWSPAEDRIVERFARAFVEGRTDGMADAQQACAAALRQHASRPGRKTLQARSSNAVRGRIQKYVSAFGLPAVGRLYTAAESRIAERYVRDVIAGRYRIVESASRELYSRLMVLYRRQAARRGAVIRPAGRSFEAVDGWLRVLLRRTGWRRRNARRWQPVERRIAAKWLARWRRFSTAVRPWSIEDTARELRDDLASRGFFRTQESCSGELLLQKAGRITAEKFVDQPPKPERPKPGPTPLRGRKSQTPLQ
ncbi:MAG: hypothetical protein R6X13_00840 [bacterium]